MKKRIEFIDVAKGIAIICIVMGHLGFLDSNGTDVVGRYVFQFHVPVFFLISGYFLSLKNDARAFFWAKAKRLFTPYVFTIGVLLIALICFQVFLGHIKPPSIFPSFRDFAIASVYGAGSPTAKLPNGVMHIGAIWFLEALFVSLLEVRLCLRAKKAAPAIIVALFIAGIWSSNYIWLPLNIQSGLMGGGYVYLGHIAREHSLLERRFPPAVVISCVVISIGAFFFGINVSLVRAYCGAYFLGIPVSLTSSYMCLAIAKLITERTRLLRNILDFFGKNSLCVLSVHLILLDVGFIHIFLSLGIPSKYNALSFINFACQLFICAMFILIAQRVPVLQSVFYGSQKRTNSSTPFARFAQHNRDLLSMMLKAIAISLLLEVAVFNLPYWSSQLYEGGQTVKYSASEGLKASGSKYIVNEDAYVEFDAEGVHVDNVELQLKTKRTKSKSIRKGAGEIVPIHLSVTDAGNEEFFNLPTTQYCSGMPSTHYVRVHLSGSSKKIRIYFEQIGQRIQIEKIAINSRQPFEFSIPRAILVLACIMLFQILRPSSRLYASSFSERPGITKAVTAVTVTSVAIIVIGVTFVAGIHHSPETDAISEPANGGYVLDFNHYNHLADSIIAGKPYLDLPVSETLKSLSNPYDRNARMNALSEANESVYMDYAYYKERYYCYFGVLPALTTFVPYKLATGRDLSTDDAVRLFCILSLVSLALLVYILYRRFFPTCSLGIYMLALISILSCQGILGLAYVPTTYSIPILSALFFSTLGLSFWLMAGDDAESLKMSRLTIGSVFLALTLACRPQFILVLFAAFAIFGREIRKGLFFKIEKVSLLNTFCVILPFLLIAIPVMYYNYIRFGSFFDFGATYNLTGADMTNRGFIMSRLPGCLFEYYFQPLNINFDYPFIHGINMANDFQGFWFYEPFLGGFFAFAPICLTLPILWFKRKTFERADIWWICVTFLGLALIVTVLDAQMASITYRYFGDFGWLLLVATWLVIWQFFSNISLDELRRSTWLVLIVALAMIGILINGWSLLSDDRYSAMVNTFPYLYYGVKSTLSFIF